MQLAKQNGFTLIELMITLTIASILIGVAASSFHQLIQQTRLITATNALYNAMNLARMEAIKRNGRVDLMAHNASWKNGWTITAGDQLIFTHEALHEDMNVTSTLPASHIAYNGTGRTRADIGGNAFYSGNIRLSMGNHSRLIVISFLGRIRVCNPETAPAATCLDTTSH